MKAKWLWTTWATVGLVATIALQGLFLYFMTVAIVPKFQKLLYDGIVDNAVLEETELTWMPEFLADVKHLTEQWGLVILFAAAAAWAIFEWRVKSEHKPFIRFSALGTAATILALVVALVASVLLICFTLAAPAMKTMARPWAEEQVSSIDGAIRALEAGAKKDPDWAALDQQARIAESALRRLMAGPALSSLSSPVEQRTLEELRARVAGASERVSAARTAIQSKNADRLEQTLREFRETFGAIKSAAKRPTS
jgi:hypothetical protein